MRSTRTVFGTAMHRTRGMWPWSTLLGLASALAVAMSIGVFDRPAMREVRASDSTAHSPGELAIAEPGGTGSFQSAPLGFTAMAETCGAGGRRMLYVGLNNWIPAEPVGATCRVEQNESRASGAQHDQS